MTQILLAGIAVQDFVFAVETLPRTAEKHRAKDLAVVGGGIAANASVAVARLGGHAHLITRLGDDVIGRDIRAGLEAEGVDCSRIITVPGRRSPLSAILVDATGERLVVSYSDPQMPPLVEQLPAALPPDIDAVLVDSRWEAGSHHVVRLARAAGKPAVLDLDRAVADEGLVNDATHVIMSRQALREFAKTDDLPEGLSRLALRFPTWLAVTDGARGLYFQQNGDIAHMPAFPIKAVDTLGAGDVFHGAFVFAIAEGMPIRQALRFASATSAIKCTRFGGRAGTPTRPEVEAFLAMQG